MFIALAIAILLLALAFGLYLLLRSLGGERPAADARTPPRPDWANFFSLAEWEAFIREVRRYFDATGARYQLDVNGVHLADGSMHYGLANMAQVCRQLARAEWAAFIAHHFTTMEQSKSEEAELERKIGDFEQVKALLMVRLGAEKAFPADAPLIKRVDLPGTLSYLAFDLPSTVRSVSADEAAPWGKSHAELLAVGLANVRRTVRPEISRQELKPGQEAYVFTGDSFFIASHALLLEEHPHCLGTGGALLAVPHRHCLIAYPINTMEVVTVVDVLGIIAMGMEREGPGSISPRLYWYHDGRYRDLPFTFTNKAFQLQPPEEFIAMLDTLASSSAE